MTALLTAAGKSGASAAARPGAALSMTIRAARSRRRGNPRNPDRRQRYPPENNGQDRRSGRRMNQAANKMTRGKGNGGKQAAAGSGRRIRDGRGCSRFPYLPPIRHLSTSPIGLKDDYPAARQAQAAALLPRRMDSKTGTDARPYTINVNGWRGIGACFWQWMTPVVKAGVCVRSRIPRRGPRAPGEAAGGEAAGGRRAKRRPAPRGAERRPEWRRADRSNAITVRRAETAGADSIRVMTIRAISGRKLTRKRPCEPRNRVDCAGMPR
jgi:hypothetical protein